MSSNALKTATPFSVADHRVDPSILRVIRDGEEARLEAKAMRVLVYLAELPGQVVSRSELEAQLWPGRRQFVQGRYGQSASTFQRVLDINPAYTRARMWNAAALAHAGFRDRAEWEAAELLVSSPDFALARLEFAFPFKDPRALDTLTDGLRKAGLPD